MIEDRVDVKGPKRLLAIDGGGIRGLIALEILAKLEADLRVANGRPGLVLADVFDYVGGTSTGALIATGISLGMETARLISLYCDRGAEMFDKASLLDRARHVYREDPLEAILREELGADTTLGSDKLRTLLLIVLRNATTDSPWPISNNPRAKYNDRSLPDCNLDLPLWQLVRASTAAPSYFAPETIRLGGTEFVFIDGGVTPYNNPAFQLFTMATLDGYRLSWPTGEGQLLLVSIGTGNTAFERPDLTPDDMHLLYHATATPSALIASAAAQQDMLCRVFGRCRAGREIDGELGDLQGTAGLVDDRLFTYVRYDHELTRRGLDELDLADIQVEEVVPLDSVEHLDQLRRVGRAIAEVQVDLKHLEGFDTVRR